MQEHLTRFYCFYCNHISYSKKELEVHLLQHKYPFRCQYCGQGYMRRAHLLNHIERLHSKDVGPQCNNTQTTIPETFSLSTTFVPRVHKTNAPTVKVRIPGPVARNDHGNKGRQRCKTADLNVLNAPKVSPQLISPMKNFVQHNMALTVPLPEEVSIPAGCMVELIEMKTVNGTKELKLRLVSHQQNTSVLDDPVLQHSTSVNPFSTALNPRNLFGNSKTCVNSKKPTVNNSNVWHPPTFQTNVDKNALNTFHSGMSGTKKTLQESVIHNVEIPYALPTRVPRISEYPSRQSMAEPTAQAETMKPKIDHSAPIVAGKTAKKVTNSANQAIKEALSSCKTPQRENKLVVECPGIPLELQVAVKEEPNYIVNKTMAKKIKEEPLKQNDQTRLNTTSLTIPSNVTTTAHCSRTTQTFSDCKIKNVAEESTILMNMLKRPGSTLIAPVSTKQTKVEDCSSLQNSCIWSESGAGGNRPFEPFPVISSVFSLSQQQDEVHKSSIRPLVKALRGIVMMKDSPSVQVSEDRTENTEAVTEHKEVLTMINCTQDGNHNNNDLSKRLLTHDFCGVVKSQPSEKCSQQTQTQILNYYIKEETSNTTRKDENQNRPICITQCEPMVVQNEGCVNHTLNAFPIAGESTGDGGDGQGPTPESATKNEDGPLKFLTVSLERIHTDFWKPSKKRSKLSKTKTRPSTRGLCQEAFLYPAPLKVGQLVIRPGPNQPIVVLNHPKPTVAKRTYVDHLAEAQVSSEVPPKCQILKMRLSKVMGDKYEVIGCTVGLFS